MTIVAERLRDYRGALTDTAIWDDFELRADDVIVCTPPKCGTTWMLHIAMMLILGRAEPDAGGSQQAPWLDCAFRDQQVAKSFLDGLDRRRVIKTHTPLDGVPVAREPDYIVVYRHPVDVHFSLRSHAGHMKEDMLGHLFPDDEREGFHLFLTATHEESGTDDLTLAALVRHYTEARDRAAGGNVHFFHYADLSRDLPGQIARLSGILGIGLAPATLREITEATTFASMRKAAEQSTRRFAPETPFHDMADFYASGTSGKWRGRLTEEDMAAYAARIAELLPAEDVAWLEWGDRLRP